MDDSFDAFDPERFRLSPEMAAELARAKAERDAGKRKANKPAWLADKIAATSTGAGKLTGSVLPYVTVRLRDAAKAFAAVNCQKAMVYLWLVYRARVTGRRVIKVTSDGVAKYGVGADAKWRAIQQLEADGIISVDQKSRGKNPTVTLL